MNTAPKLHDVKTGCSESSPLLNPEDSGNERQGQSHATSSQEEEQMVLVHMSFTKLALTMTAAWIGIFLGAMDETIVATLAGPISSEFRSLNLLSWLATAYLISAATVLPVTGRLSDIFGRGYSLCLSNVLFAAGNLICGLAEDQYTMLLGRIIAGIGSSGMRSIASFLASDLIPLRRRGVVQAIANLCYGSGAMLGAVFGGLLNDYTVLGWRLAFLIQVPPSLISAVAVLVLVKVPPKQSAARYIDYLGVLMVCSSTILLLVGLNCGGNLVPWAHPLPLTTIPLSTLIFAGFIRWELKAVQPIIPVKFLLNRTILAVCSTNFFSEMLVLAAVLYVPLFLQVLGDSASSAGQKLLPSPIGDSLAALGAGLFMKHTGTYVGLCVPSLGAIVLGAALFALQNESSPAWLSSVGFFSLGAGYGAMLTTTQVACLAAVDHSQQAVVMSAIYFIRSIGSALGISAASALYQSTLKARLWWRFGNWPGADNQIGRILDSLDELQSLPDGWHDGVIQSYMEAFRSVWLMLLTWAVLGLICILPIKQHRLYLTLARCSEN